MIKAHINSDMVFFWCPGCDRAHGVPVVGPKAWEFNGSAESPTLSPSLLVGSIETLIDADLPWEELIKPENVKETPTCHSFVTDGKIRFLEDSTHELAGQTVDLPEWWV